MNQFKNLLMRKTPAIQTRVNAAGDADCAVARAPEYRLACGRTVRLEECYISVSMLGFLAGRKEVIRAEVIRQLPERVRAHFPGNYGVVIKPVPEGGELPTFTFMLALTCDQPVCDPTADYSSLILCWLGDDIETSLPELIARETCAVEWDKHAVDFNL